jgi:hypothetical protein
MLLREKNRVLRAAATRGNARKGAHSLSLSFSCAWLPGVKNPELFFGHFETAGEKIDGLDQGSIFSAVICGKASSFFQHSCANLFL